METIDKHVPKQLKPFLWPKGISGNPNGRPKTGETMKEYARKWYANLTPEEKTAYILAVEEKRPGFAWTMAEGNPTEDRNVRITAPRPILGASTQPLEVNAAESKEIGGTVAEAVLEDTHDESQ